MNLIDPFSFMRFLDVGWFVLHSQLSIFYLYRGGYYQYQYLDVVIYFFPNKSKVATYEFCYIEPEPS